MSELGGEAGAVRGRLDLELLNVESFEIPGYGKCACCGELDALDADGYCEGCGPVDERYDYGTPDCNA